MDREESLNHYLDLLLKWNSKFNLTAITEPDKIRSHHFEDSLAPLKFIQGKNSLIDLGTGAGFPGIPLKIYYPEIRTVLIEAKRKKVSFCSEVIRELGLKDIEVIQGRAEDPYIYRELGYFDIVISRATWPLDVYLEMADPYLGDDSMCITMRGSNWKTELKSAQEKMKRHLLKLVETYPYSIREDEKRCLLIFKKDVF